LTSRSSTGAAGLCMRSATATLLPISPRIMSAPVKSCRTQHGTQHTGHRTHQPPETARKHTTHRQQMKCMLERPSKQRALPIEMRQ
jgi:hypothetical protein